MHTILSNRTISIVSLIGLILFNRTVKVDLNKLEFNEFVKGVSSLLIFYMCYFNSVSITALFMKKLMINT